MLSVQDIKEQIPIEEVLAHYGVRINRSGYGWGDWISVSCTFHGKDRNPSAGVNRRMGVFVCHTCDVKGDIFSVVQIAEGVTFKGAMQYLEDHFL